MVISGDVFYYSVAFVVPGFILNWVISRFIPDRIRDSQLSFVRFFALSCLNNALWLPVIVPIHEEMFYKAYPIFAGLIWIVVLLLSPIAVGVAIGWAIRRRVGAWALRRLGFNPIALTPTAWDYKFNGTTRPVFMMITLKDGILVAGRYAGKSFASSEPAERDLYVEETYQIAEDGKWKVFSPKSGIWVAGDDIKRIEFFDN